MSWAVKTKVLRYPDRPKSTDWIPKLIATAPTEVQANLIAFRIRELYRDDRVYTEESP
jgi:hypothetical protein